MLRVSSLIKLASVVIAAAALVNLLKSSNEMATASSADQVRAVFAAYRHALLTDDGATAAGLLSAATIDWYGQAQQLALYGNKDQVDRLPAIAKVQALAFRHRVPAETLRQMSPRQLVVYAVEHGWIGKPAAERSALGEISVSGDTAVAELLLAKRDSHQQYRFVKENGHWRFDQLPLLTGGEARLEFAAQVRGLTPDQLILSLIESASHTKVSPEIWNPPFPQGPPGDH